MKRTAMLSLLLVGALAFSVPASAASPEPVGFTASHEVVQLAVPVDVSGAVFEVAKLDKLPVSVSRVDVMCPRSRVVLFIDASGFDANIAQGAYASPASGSPWRLLRTSA